MGELRHTRDDSRFGRIAGRDARGGRAHVAREDASGKTTPQAGGRPPRDGAPSPADRQLARREAALSRRRAPAASRPGTVDASDVIPEAAGEVKAMRRHRVARRNAGRVIAAARTTARFVSEPTTSAEGEMEQLGDRAAGRAAGSATDAVVTRLRARAKVRRAISSKATTAEPAAVKAQVIGGRDVTAAPSASTALSTVAPAPDAAAEGARGASRRAWFRSARRTASGVAGSVAQGGAAAAAVSSGSAKGAAAMAARATLSDVVKAIVTSTGGILAVLAPAAIILVMLASIVMGIGTGAYRRSTGTLTGTEAEAAEALKAAGLNDVQTAAVIGNLEAESGLDPTAEAVFDGTINYAYERAYGLFQFTDAGSSASSLVVRRMSDFFQWCTDNGKDRTTVAAQVEFWAKGYRSDWLTGLHSSGYYESIAPDYASMPADLATWDSTDDVRFATYLFFACNGRGAASVAHLDRRYEAAERVYAALRSGTGTGQEYSAASDDQRAIADACRLTGPVPGGYCATWVTNVYTKAQTNGAAVTIPTGNACDMYYSYCTSSDRDDLEVGMLVAVPSVVGGTQSGRDYGHVGIYVGDGYVMHSTEGEVRTNTLDDWLAIYNKGGTARWGFPG